MAVSRLPASAYGPLGRVHVRVSRIGFGGYRVDDRSDVHREALREALVSGITLVDTSSNYADGHSEILVGEVVRDVLSRGATRREDLVLATKAGYGPGHEPARGDQPGPRGSAPSPPAASSTNCRASLLRSGS
jgi:aryl-alcohol dehydrogenase-like predicted oxidoreductase